MTQHFRHNFLHKAIIISTLAILILQGCAINRLAPGDYEVYPTSDKSGCVPANKRLILNEDNTCQLLSNGHGSNEDSSSQLLCTWKRNRKSVALSLTDSEYNFSNSDDKLNAKGKIEFRDFDYTNYTFLYMVFNNQDTSIHQEYNLKDSLTYDIDENHQLEKISISQLGNYVTTYHNKSNKQNFAIYPIENLLMINGQAEILVDIETLKKFD